MDNIPPNKLLVVTDDEFKDTRKMYNVTKETLNIVIDNLIIWYQLQPHLPQIVLDRAWLERILISNKCSMERAKRRLDMIFSAKNAIPEFFLNRNVKQTMERANISVAFIPLPKLTPDKQRIFIVKCMTQESSNFIHLEMIKLMTFLYEYKQRHDYSVGDIHIIDMRDHNLGHVLRYNPAIVKKAEFTITEIFGCNLAGVHLVHTGPVLEKFLQFLSVVFSKTLRSRIGVHADFDSIFKIFPREIFPKDYGGEEKTSREIFADWENELCSDKYVRWIKDQEYLTSDESKRPGENPSENLFGIPGSFKQLTIE